MDSNDTQRETEPGFVLHAYQRAKAKVIGLAGRGKAKATALMAGGAADDAVTSGQDWKDKAPEEVSEADRVRSQEEMKETFDGDGVMPSDKRHKGQPDDGQAIDGQQASATDRHHEARTDLPDGSATAVMAGGDASPRGANDDAPRRADESDLSGDVDDGGMRGEVELAAPDVHASLGTDDDSAAPEMSALDQAALAKLAEDEAGRVPDQGLGLDDGPRVTYPSDPGA